MDLATLRARLPGMTRGVFGERVTVRPIKAGKMGAAADSTRPPMVGLDARFDMAPDLEQIGGGRERPEAARISADHSSASFDLAALPWVPEQGDHVERVDPVTGEFETYRIDSTSRPIPGVLLCLLSRL